MARLFNLHWGCDWLLHGDVMLLASQHQDSDLVVYSAPDHLANCVYDQLIICSNGFVKGDLRHVLSFHSNYGAGMGRNILLAASTEDQLDDIPYWGGSIRPRLRIHGRSIHRNH